MNELLCKEKGEKKKKKDLNTGDAWVQEGVVSGIPATRSKGFRFVFVFFVVLHGIVTAPWR